MALTEQKRRYAAARLSGLGKKESAIQAGCPVRSAPQAASRYEKDRDVLAAMGREVAAFDRKSDLPDVPYAHIPAPSDDPKAFLLGVMNDLEADPKLRVDAAKSLMPFLYGRVAAAHGKKGEKQEAAKVAAKGKFGAASPPRLQAVK